MTTFEVPGVGLAIVEGGTTVLTKGYGTRRLREETPVDGVTLFGIASNTKVVTAVALGLLVEEGMLEWEAPVIRYLPGFRMWDPYVTRELTVRDLLVHRSGLGLGAGDLLFWPQSTYSREEIVERLQYIRPATSFRSAYAYDNVLYLVAGEVVEAVSGREWEDFVAERILARLGMTGSRVRYADAVATGRLATPHARVEGKVQPVKPFEGDNVGPAGGIVSSAEDMAKWVAVLLRRGRLEDGSRLFGEGTWRELSAMVTPIPIGDAPEPGLEPLHPSFRGYALGLAVQDYRGHKIVTHTGGLPGYVSRVLLLPDRGLGVVVLTNQESGDAFNAIAYTIVDHYLGASGHDWVAAFEAARRRREERFAQSDREAASARQASSSPSLPLAEYAGTYVDAWYGEIDITEGEDGALVMRFGHTPALLGDLEHFQHDTFIVRWRDRELRADAYVTFALEPDGSIERAKMRAVSAATDFSFDFHDLLLLPAAGQPW
jgi:CubicO group peptidase (beta-lactamase class C family)